MSFLSGLPDDVIECITKLIENIHSVEDSFKAYDESNIQAAVRESQLDTLQYNLTNLYAINALFFVYLQCNGIDAKSHSIKGEMERISAKLKYCKEMKDKVELTRVPINKEACGRIIKHSLWEAAQDGTKKRKLTEEVSEVQTVSTPKSKKKKRKSKM